MSLSSKHFVFLLYLIETDRHIIAFCIYLHCKQRLSLSQIRIVCQRCEMFPWWFPDPGAELCSVGKCKALYDYSSEKKDELNMKEGKLAAT